jgi:hypothetical protein
MPDPALQATALRYAAGDLTPEEVAAFEARLAEDQDARDALAEAVRLSAAAIGQKPLAPHPASRTAIRARLGLMTHRGHPFAWAGLGAAAVAACTFIVLTVADRADAPEAVTARPALPDAVESIPPPRAVDAPTPVAPLPREQLVAIEHHSPPATCGEDSPRSVAEIWADLSTPDRIEKAHDDELRWRQRTRERTSSQHVSTTVKAAAIVDAPHP